MPAQERLDMIVSQMRTEIASVFDYTDSSMVPRDIGFLEMGMDSLMAIKLRNRLLKELGISIPPAALFEYTTVDAMAGYLLREVFDVDGDHADRQNGDESQVDFEAAHKQTPRLAQAGAIHRRGMARQPGRDHEAH